MLSAVIIVRCAIVALLITLLPTIYTLGKKIINKTQSKEWQTGFCAALGTIYINYLVLSYASYSAAPLLILVDIFACAVITFFIQKQALTKQIADDYSIAVVCSYLSNKIILTLSILLGIVISQISGLSNSNFINHTGVLLELFEVYHITPTQYIELVYLSKYNTQYSITSLLSLIGVAYLLFIDVRWFFSEYFNMKPTHKCIFAIITLMVVGQCNLFFFNLVPLNRIILCTLVYTISLMLWWWFVASETDYEFTLQNRPRTYK